MMQEKSQLSQHHTKTNKTQSSQNKKQNSPSRKAKIKSEKGIDGANMSAGNSNSSMPSSSSSGSSGNNKKRGSGLSLGLPKKRRLSSRQPTPLPLSPRTPTTPRGTSDHESHATMNNDEDDDDEEEVDPRRSGGTTKFYLRHQNRALVSELRSLRHELCLLKEERERRRNECTSAGEAVRGLCGAWRKIECTVAIAADDMLQLKGQVPFERQVPQSVGKIPSSTGEGRHVETVTSLLNSIHQLCSNGDCDDAPSPARRHKMQQDGKVESSSPGAPKFVKKEPKSRRIISDADERDTSSSSTKNRAQEYEEAVVVTSSPSTIRPNHPGAFDVAQATISVNARANNLAQLITSLIHKFDNNLSSQTFKNDDLWKKVVSEIPELQCKIETLMGSVRNSQNQIAEISVSRNDALKSERRVRRVLARLASGQVSLKEVVRDMDITNSDGGMPLPSGPEGCILATGNEEFNTDKLRTPDGVSSHSILNVAGNGLEMDGKDTRGSAVAEETKKKICDLQIIAETKSQHILHLTKQSLEMQKRINSLLLMKREEVNGERSKSKDATTPTVAEMKLAQLEMSCVRLTEELRLSRTKQAEAKGESILARSAACVQVEKHVRRWKEIVGNDYVPFEKETKGKRSTDEKYLSSRENGLVATEAPQASMAIRREEMYASKIVSLEHKLRQALQGAKHSESYRIALEEACQLNESVSAELGDLRGHSSHSHHHSHERTSSSNSSNMKNGVKNSHSSSSAHSASSTSASSLTSPSSSSSSSKTLDTSTSGPTTSNVEKLKRTNDKMKRDIGNLRVSREKARKQLELTARERDCLSRSNSRLLKQSAEKEEVYNNALSTIMQLKHGTELLTKEKDVLERQLKAAEQLALASRLAANARERVEEESTRERDAANRRLLETDKEKSQLICKREKEELRCAKISCKLEALQKELRVAKERCDELATESANASEEKARITESLAVAQQREITARSEAEAAVKAASVARNCAGHAVTSDSPFTSQQLNTQLDVLKSKLACPVCHHRDKQCILLRCRHMHCRHCIDVNIKNRSRKCPTCGNSFSTNDVANIFF